MPIGEHGFGGGPAALGDGVTPTPEAIANQAARDAYGQLVAWLAERTGDVAAAEDALADAFVAALERWTTEGVPRRPTAWLLTVARRRSIDAKRRALTAQRFEPTVALLAESVEETVPDRRLPLMFLCAHPSIDASIRAPLMLQTVLGLTAKQIGQAFLVAPAAMGQRLSRAKAKIRGAKIPFELPTGSVARERVAVVCESIYAGFTTGYSEQTPSVRHGLSGEAIWLGRLMHRRSGEHPETGGLLALMLHVEARRPARRDENGRYIPLEHQDSARWDASMIREAEAVLLRASEAGAPGRFQLEAAIQSAHAGRMHTGRTDWAAIESLYRELLSIADTLGGRVAHLAALAELEEPERAYAALVLLGEAATQYQPYWALRAHLERRTGRNHAASTGRACGLSEDPAVRAYLRAR